VLYLFLLYHDPKLPPPTDLMERHFALAADARERGAYLTSEAIGGTENATTVRVRNDQTITVDGPFAETKEVLGGFYLLDCKDLDEAIDYAQRIPDAINGAVEIRPVMHVPDWEYSMPGERRPFGS
jgi:hypothetical protein